MVILSKYLQPLDIRFRIYLLDDENRSDYKIPCETQHRLYHKDNITKPMKKAKQLRFHFSYFLNLN